MMIQSMKQVASDVARRRRRQVGGSGGRDAEIVRGIDGERLKVRLRRLKHVLSVTYAIDACSDESRRRSDGML